ncbi:POK25 protein, partial [Sapayoa aenigma]|nr:POK25 protein [Sapayoa aenigma]
FYVEGNAHADALVSAVVMGPVPNVRQQAVLSHQFFHQGFCILKPYVSNLVYHILRLVAACPECQGTHASNYFGTNPRGLQALQIWQMDVTHVDELGRQKHVHVSIDTYSHAMVATAH